MPENNYTSIVTYDTEGAEDALRSLADTAQSTMRETEAAFARGAKSSEKLDLVLGKISPTATGVLRDFRTLISGGLSPFGIAAGAAAGTAALLIKQLVDISEFTKDSAAQLDTLNEGLNKLAEIEIAGGDIGDALKEREFEDRRRDITARQAAINREKIELKEKQAGTKERLAAEKDYYAQLEDLARASISGRRSLEQQLNDLKREDRTAGQRGETDPGRQIQGLVGEAGRARESGDLDAAQDLIKQAQRIADDSGAHNFFSRQVDSERDKIIAQLEKTVQARRNEAAAISAAQAASQSRQATLEAEVKLQADVARQLQARQLGAKADSRELSLDQKQFRDTDEQGDIEVKRQAVLKQIVNLRENERGTLQKIVDLAKAATSFQGRGGLTDQARAVSGGRDLANDVFDRTRGDQAAIGTEESTRQIKQLQELITGLKATPNLSGALTFDVNNLQKAVDLLRELQSLEQQRIKATPSGNAVGPNQLPGVPPPVPANAAAATPARNAQASSTINVNATVKGGIIDPETVKTITELIRRQLRSGNGSPANVA